MTTNMKKFTAHLFYSQEDQGLAIFNKEGEKRSDLFFDSLNLVYNGLILARVKDKWGILSSDGNILQPITRDARVTYYSDVDKTTNKHVDELSIEELENYKNVVWDKGDPLFEQHGYIEELGHMGGDDGLARIGGKNKVYVFDENGRELTNQTSNVPKS